MTDRVRTVRSGSVGLDLALGGGFRFVRRTHLEDRESATLLIRGGPGTGKSVLAEDLALRLAAELGGDVLYACVEVLPSEVLAQRMGFEGFDAAQVVDLSRQGNRAPDATKPYLVLGMRDAAADAQGVPDLGSSLLDLSRIAIDRGFSPKVVVVDSLSDGYALGNSVPRPVVDGICKLAIEQGWALILVEEVADDSVSPWTFAVDTVLSLRVSAAPSGLQARRELLVTKHRFGPCEPGPHRLQIEPQRVRVIPPFSAYRNAVRDLVLPEPSTNRSLRIPVHGEPHDWERFQVEDGEGRCVLVSIPGTPEPPRASVALDGIASAIGRLAADGSSSPGAFVFIKLFEKSGSPLDQGTDGFSIETLHQFVDGEDWLEDTIAHFPRQLSQVARIRIGPTQRIDPYENAIDLKRGISMLANLLTRRGFVVVLFGQDVTGVIRAGIVTDFWSIAPVKPETAPANASFSATIVYESQESDFTFFPKLES